MDPLEYIVIVEPGVYMPTSIKKSGSKVTVKIVNPIAVLLNSIRSATISSEKGTQNPPHIHQNVPKSVRPK